MSAATSLLAQTAPSAQPQEMKKDADVLPPVDAARAPAGADGPTLMVKGFRLTGNTYVTTIGRVPPGIDEIAGDLGATQCDSRVTSPSAIAAEKACSAGK